jgi:pyruvate/2-oxoglutarate dehydrogenase complex dihydrolipoamide dehydrogenase (E3) component
VASIFNAFGSRVTLFETARHILMSEDEDVAAAMSAALAGSGIRVLEGAGRIERFDGAPPLGAISVRTITTAQAARAPAP